MHSHPQQTVTRADWIGLAKVIGLIDLGIALCLLAFYTHT